MQERINPKEEDLVQAITRLINTMSILIDSYSRIHEDYHNVTATLQRVETKMDNIMNTETFK